MTLWDRFRVWLYGPTLGSAGSAKRDATELIARIAHRGLQGLSDEELMQVVEVVARRDELRVPLRGNVRFIDSVLAQWERKGSITLRQRVGLMNILERAYPHNLAAELRNLR